MRMDGAHLQAGIEGTLLQFLGARTERIHEVTANGSITLDLAREY